MANFQDFPQPENSALQRSKSLSECIRQEMNKQGGQMSFDTFMGLSLYHPQFGYYNADTIAFGQRGDFTTAAEISPLYAACFAQQALPIFEYLNERNILEIGAGSGRFAYDLLLTLHQLGGDIAHYYIFEISPILRKKQQDFLRIACPDFFHRITWLTELPQNFIGVIIANEVLDALPVHCFHIEKEDIQEKCVAWEQDQFVFRLSNPTSLELLEKVSQLRELYFLNPGYESEINLGLSSFIQATANALAKGIILFADYGYGQQEYYHPERWRGTLTCFYQHRYHDNPLIFPGLQDITAHVDFTRVAEEAINHQCSLVGYTSQAAFLLACGLMDLAVEKEKGLSQIDAFTLHQDIKLLTMPTEMGERVKVMALSKNVELRLFGFGLQDRRRDL